MLRSGHEAAGGKRRPVHKGGPRALTSDQKGRWAVGADSEDGSAVHG